MTIVTETKAAESLVPESEPMNYLKGTLGEVAMFENVIQVEIIYDLTFDNIDFDEFSFIAFQRPDSGHGDISGIDSLNVWDSPLKWRPLTPNIIISNGTPKLSLYWKTEFPTGEDAE